MGVAWKKANPERVKAYRAEYYRKNKIREREVTKRWEDRNPHLKRANGKRYRTRHAAKIRKYRQSDEAKARRNAIERQRYADDPAYRLTKILRVSFRQALKGRAKPRTVIALVGCDLSELSYHLERQFLPGMSWDNYGRSSGTGWEVDHITPVSAFDMTDAEHVAACWHWSNLQPLWKLDNVRKGGHRSDIS
jgi:hypothetical protein